MERPLTDRAQIPATTDTAFWRDLRDGLRIAAHKYVETATKVTLASEVDDLVQMTIEDAIQFFRRKVDGQAISKSQLEELRSETTKWSKAALRNNFYDEVRTVRRRSNLLDKFLQGSNEVEGSTGIVRGRVDRPDEIASARALVSEITAVSGRSERYGKMAAALGEMVADCPASPTPADLASEAGVTSKDVDDFRRMLAGRGITPRTERD
jgi:hypothetical protein